VLSAADQERFSRHLLLDQLGGRGQERVCAGAVEIDLPAEARPVARACARALASAGIGQLFLLGPWSAALEPELRELSSALEIVSNAHQPRAPSASLIKVYFVHEASAAPRPFELQLGPAPGASRSPAESSALGSLAALEALKLLAGSGRPAPQPLSVFP